MKKIEIEIPDEYEIDSSLMKRLISNGSDDSPSHYINIPLKKIEIQKEIFLEGAIKHICWKAYIHHFDKINIQVITEVLVPEFDKWFEENKHVLS
jgi:hypothetical protein